MPFVQPSTFRPAWWLSGPHAQTIWPTVFRRVPHRPSVRRRLELADGDFLDVDAYPGASPRTAIITHGLEGSSRSKYVLGMAVALQDAGWTVWAWNCRACSGEPNRLPRSYHSGATEDLQAILTAAKAAGLGPFAVIGFSLGANLTLKFAGEDRWAPDDLAAAVGISCPCDLGVAADWLDAPRGVFYRGMLVRALRRRIARKARQFGDGIPREAVRKAMTFRAFDDAYTAPFHGFRDAADYYARCSARGFLAGIRRPALVLNSADDPMIPPECLPIAEAAANPWVHLESPAQGGHVGFITGPLTRLGYWAETRTVEFLHQAANLG